MDIKETLCEYEEWIHLVNTVISLQSA